MDNIQELNEKLEQFFNASRKLVWKQTHNQDMQRLYKMANLKQKDTGLPMIIWIDTPPDKKMCDNTPRLKFQPNKSIKNSEILCSMSIEDEPRILSGDFGKLKQKHINQLKQWVIQNKEDLLKVWNGKLSHVKFVQNNKKLCN